MSIDLSNFNWVAFSAIIQALMVIATYIAIMITLNENVKSKKFAFLREKLDFYSRLISYIPIDEINQEHPEDISYSTKDKFIKFLINDVLIQVKYPLMCESELKKLFQEIMPTIIDKRELHKFEKIEEKIPLIIIQINKDFNKLKKEYEKF